MPATSVHVDDLNAYADGRLPAARRQAIEAYLAANPDAATHVAAWRRNDALLRSELDPLLNEPLPQHLIPPSILVAARKARWSSNANVQSRLRILAMSIGCLVVGIGAGWVGRGALNESVPMQRFANDALVSHVVYAPERKHMVEVPAGDEAHLVAWLSKRLDAHLYIPDLAPLGYRLIGGRQTVAADAPAAMLMYEDKTGTRISVQLRRMPNDRDTAFRVEMLPPDIGVRVAAFSEIDRPRPMAFYWVDQGLGFAVSGPLARPKLLAVAQAVYQQYSLHLTARER
ncbi:anti-sigma factor [Burkholderia aenigmatica]|uniref:Anti-sigma factor n=1 Tax=Burkholderia aenigmatica TaxID=2015348 RepID=A0A6P2I1Z3_9BURK|nr:anti-sigma factor [Burkholderia aenigmatica]VWB23258.1 anti-sigma factor [Burkholderia aenigmatica]